MKAAGEARNIVAITFLLNVLLCASHFVVFWMSGSQVVLAQGADSLMDLAVGLVLMVSVHVAAQPRDENHPFGHQRAEPIGALVTAVLAGVLAIEVARSAVLALMHQAEPSIDVPVYAVLGAKLIVKIVLLLSVLRLRRGLGSQAVDATRLDTLNDVLTTSSSIVGALLVRGGWASADAILALPIAAYIGKNGYRLARESLRYLMGEAPDPAVREELRAKAASIEGVLEVSKLRAHYVGSVLHVEVTLLIAAGSSAAESHDIGLDVQKILEADPRVGDAFIHVDTGRGKDGS